MLPGFIGFCLFQQCKAPGHEARFKINNGTALLFTDQLLGVLQLLAACFNPDQLLLVLQQELIKFIFLIVVAHLESKKRLAGTSGDMLKKKKRDNRI